jgi:predicted nucleic acid-binding protein
VAASLARVGWPAVDIDQYVSSLAARAVETLAITATRARRIRGIAVRTRLRAADAIYVWMASLRQLSLVTLDQEVIARGATVCTVISP